MVSAKEMCLRRGDEDEYRLNKRIVEYMIEETMKEHERSMGGSEVKDNG
jgi:hypothetical protein